MKVNLEFIADSSDGVLWSVRRGTSRIGRAPDNDLVIPESAVSAYHLVLMNDASCVSIRDLGSTNGTYVNEEKVDGTTALHDADLLRIGLHVRARVVLQPDDSPGQRADGWLVHLNTGRSFSLTGAISLMALLENEHPLEDFADALEPDEETEDGVLTHQLRIAGDVVVVDGPEGVRRHPLNARFDIGPHRFVALSADDAVSTTVSSVDTRWTLRVDIGGRAGAQAYVVDPEGRSQGSIRAANRVAVLHQLVQQLVNDRSGGVGENDVGWASDEDLMQGVWGRLWRSKGPASFQVLVHRVRKDLARMGLSGSMIEKRAGFTRLKPGTVRVEPSDLG